VLSYRDPATRNHKQIAADLGVATLLEGTVRRAGTKVRVTAQLINARTDESLWAETYDVDLTDAFTIQSALAQNITAALKANFTTGERAYVAERPTLNEDAYDLYLRARGLVSENPSKDNVEQSIALLESAVAKDPTFVAAHKELANLNSALFWLNNGEDIAQKRKARALAAVEAAVKIAPDKAETRVARGIFAYNCENDFAKALSEYRAAAVVLPNDAQVAFFISLSLRRLGNAQEAAITVERAVNLNPRDFAAATAHLQMLFALRRFEQVRIFGARYAAIFGRRVDVSVTYAVLELSHDVESYLRELEAQPDTNEGIKFFKRYERAMMHFDFVEAARVVADAKDPGTFTRLGLTGVLEPVSQYRALIAYLSGDREAARVHADETLAYYRGKAWPPRSSAGVKVLSGLALAFAGRGDEAIKSAREGCQWLEEHDRGSAFEARNVVAQVYLVLDRREEAFALLRESVAAPSLGGSPEMVRHNPLWRRVKDDPRFEEILKSAKPL
jgi:tetratricopeptide (TPR) repeat protein